MKIIYFNNKVFALICFLLISSIFLHAQQPKVAVVLGGGGAKGFTHIGVLKVLEEEGIPIDMIVGTSIGSIAGGLYSIGYSADEIAEISRNNNWEQLLTDYIPRKYLSPQSKAIEQRYLLSLPFNVNKKITLPRSLVTGQNVLTLFCELASEVPEEVDFSTLPISFACIATDLETGEEVVLNNGFLPKAIFSSMSIPGAFSPSEYGGRLLVDGGLVNNFPTDVAEKMGADIIIGVDLGSGYKTRDELQSIGDVIDQIVTFNTTAKKEENIKRCDIFIHPDINGYSTGSFTTEAVDTLLRRGYEAGLSVVDQIRALKERYNLKPRTVSKDYIGENRWNITDIEISGNTIMSKEKIRSNLGLEIPGRHSSIAIKNAIYDLKGYGSVEMAYYSISDNSTGKTLNLKIIERDAAELKIGKTVANLNVGLNMNSTDAIQLLLNSTTKRYRKGLNLLSVDAVVSPNPELSILTESMQGRLPSFGILLQGKYSKFNLFVDGKKSNSAETYYGAGSIYAHKRLGYFFDFGGGVKQEYFDGKVFGKVDENLPTLENNSAFVTNFYGYAKYDDLDDYYFPTKGAEIYAEYSLVNDSKSDNDLGSIIMLKMRGVVSVSPKVAMIFNANGRAIFNDNTSTYKRTIVGDEDYDIYLNYHLPFIGINQITEVSNYVLTGLTGIRFNFLKTHFLTLKGNLFFDNNNLQDISNTRVLWGAGASYAIKSGVGPLEITGGFSDYFGNSNFTFNLGYWF